MPADNPKEMFYWVDEHDVVIGAITRKQAHDGSKKIHRSVGIFVLNPQKNKMVLQQRSNEKDVDPNMWSYAVGGHVTYGQTCDQTAQRELQEELGITDVEPIYIGKNFIQMEHEREYVAYYRICLPEHFHFSPDSTEVSNVLWIDIADLPSFIDSHPTSAWTIKALKQTGYI